MHREDLPPRVPGVRQPPSPPASPRLRIARLAAEAASAVSGVVGLRPGPLGLHATSGAGHRVDGVVVAALRDGRYEIDLYLVCALVSLPALAERVRTAVLETTSAAGLAEAVGPVNVRVEEITDS